MTMPSRRKLEAYSSPLQMQPKRVRAARGFPGALPPLAPRREGELLEEMHVLLVLEEGSAQRRDELPRIALTQGIGADILGQKELEPIEELGSRGLLPQPRHLADLEEDAQRLLDEAALDARIMHRDDAVHRLGVGEADIVEEAAA